MGWGGPYRASQASPSPPCRAANSPDPVEGREEEPKITHPETHQGGPQVCSPRPGGAPSLWRLLRAAEPGGGARPQRRRKGSPEEAESPRCAERRKESQVLLNKRHLSIQQENGAGSRRRPHSAWPGLGSVTSPTSCQACPAHVRTQEDTHRHTCHHLCTRACLSGRAAHLSFTWFCAPAPPPLAPSVLPPLWPPPLHSTSVRSSMTAVSLGSSRLNSLAKRMKWM